MSSKTPPILSVREVMDIGWEQQNNMVKDGLFVRYPVPELAKLIGPFRPGEYFCIGAPTHHGKSVMARIWATDAARRLKEEGHEDTIVLYVSAEDGATTIQRRLIENSGIELPSRYQMMMNGAVVKPKDQARLSSEISRGLEQLKIVTVTPDRDGDAYFSPDTIRRIIDKVRSGDTFGGRKVKVAMVVLDYLSALRNPGDPATDWTVVGEANEKAYQLARGMEVFVVAAAQTKLLHETTGPAVSFDGGTFNMPSMANVYGGPAIPQRQHTLITQVVPKNVIPVGQYMQVRNDVPRLCRENMVLQFVAKDKTQPGEHNPVNRIFYIIMEDGWQRMRLATEEDLK